MKKKEKLQEHGQKRAQKKDDALAKLANQQLQIDLDNDNQNEKDQADYQNNEENRIIEDTNVLMIEEAKINRNTRGREIRLPQRFRPIKS